MYCSKCGFEINDEAIICPKCGCYTNNQLKEKDVLEDNISVGLVILSILIPIVGVILGIINLCSKKTKSGTAYMIIGVVAWVVYSSIFKMI